ncbi:O-antigen ligase family protein [Mucilaginibacter sp. HMF5004]|uniref:O-antigen ligase family protein n=1 Tax=Mucilaginibacter rivuli TaxID=2857527 RepID=UPI001C5EEAF9|nr:O-antigen ligase family protein [Mucilaginibacter rivuli]MBW4890925.1 O-antigen ligase family protein [Mucilaginibacter rivuli]
MDIVIHIDNPQKPSGFKNRLSALWKDILLKKLAHPASLIFLTFVCLILALLLYKIGVIAALLFIILMVGPPLVYGIVFYPKFGIIALFVSAYLLFIPMKMDTHGFPLGTVMDLLEFLLILGFFIQQKKDRQRNPENRQWHYFTDKLSIVMLIWIGYNFLEVLNPQSVSALAWIFTIRTTAVVILMYYVFVYQIREVSFITLMFKIWIGLAALGALNGIKQEFIGFSSSESQYLYSDPVKVGLLFIDGHMRKFSIFSDPVAFAYNMTAASILCITLMYGPIKTSKKYILFGLVLLFMFSMLFSGTRGAYPLVPVAMGLFSILNFNKKVLYFVIGAAALFGVLIFMPTSNPNIMRFQTAFKPNNDPSFNVRKINQAKIRPFIQSHPFGGGLGSTGQWGQRFAPNSQLANFPPDSGYVRVAVELGYIGLILICIVVFMALYCGINNYYLIHDPRLKNYCLAVTLVVFAYNIGNYPQEAIVQFPSNVVFFFAMAIIPVCYRLDRQKLKEAANAN